MRRVLTAFWFGGMALLIVAAFLLLTDSADRLPGGYRALSMVGLAGGVLFVCGLFGRRMR